MFDSRSLQIGLALIASLVFASAAPAAADHRARLVEAILSEDVSQQATLIQSLAEIADPLVEQTLTAWRGGGVFLFETNDTRTAFILDPQADNDGKAKGIRVIDGEFLKDPAGKPM